MWPVRFVVLKLSLDVLNGWNLDCGARLLSQGAAHHQCGEIVAYELVSPARPGSQAKVRQALPPRATGRTVRMSESLCVDENIEGAAVTGDNKHSTSIGFRSFP